MTPFLKKKAISLGSIFRAALILAMASSIYPARSEEQVGVAVTVRNDVTGKLQSNVVRVSDGASVYGKEIVKTAADSSAKLVLKDNTNLNVGPNSSVSLDNFVFAGSSDYKQAGFNLAKGAFRFTSGASDKRSYDLKTPVATIGVRGTDFVVIVNDKKSHVEVSDGLTLVCPAKATSKEAVVLDIEEKRRCQKEHPNNKTCGCTKKCGEVSSSRAVDVTDEYVCASEFTNTQVGENSMSFAEATSAGPTGFVMGAAMVGIAGGAILGANQRPGQPPLLVPPNRPISISK